MLWLCGAWQGSVMGRCPGVNLDSVPVFLSVSQCYSGVQGGDQSQNFWAKCDGKDFWHCNETYTVCDGDMTIEMFCSIVVTSDPSSCHDLGQVRCGNKHKARCKWVLKDGEWKCDVEDLGQLNEECTITKCDGA
jgi:hypothetical protein